MRKVIPIIELIITFIIVQLKDSTDYIIEWFSEDVAESGTLQIFIAWIVATIGSFIYFIQPIHEYNFIEAIIISMVVAVPIGIFVWMTIGAIILAIISLTDRISEFKSKVDMGIIKPIKLRKSKKGSNND
jgi:hypothetical protein